MPFRLHTTIMPPHKHYSVTFAKASFPKDREISMELSGGITQPEVMAVSLEKLGVRPGDIAADIGCGTGTVTKAIAALTGAGGCVYAVDRRPAAVSITRGPVQVSRRLKCLQARHCRFFPLPTNESTAPSSEEAVTLPQSLHDWTRRDAEASWSMQSSLKLPLIQFMPCRNGEFSGKQCICRCPDPMSLRSALCSNQSIPSILFTGAANADGSRSRPR